MKNSALLLLLSLALQAQASQASTTCIARESNNARTVVEFDIDNMSVNLNLYVKTYGEPKTLKGVCQKDAGSIGTAITCHVSTSTDSGYELRLASQGNSTEFATYANWSMNGTSQEKPLSCAPQMCAVRAMNLHYTPFSRADARCNFTKSLMQKDFFSLDSRKRQELTNQFIKDLDNKYGVKKVIELGRIHILSSEPFSEDATICILKEERNIVCNKNVSLTSTVNSLGAAITSMGQNLTHSGFKEYFIDNITSVFVK